MDEQRIQFEIYIPDEKVFELGNAAEILCVHACHELKWRDISGGWWVLEIEEGQATVKCEICGCVFDGVHDDADSLFTLQPLPIRLDFDSHCSGHRDGYCDCDWSFDISPRKERNDPAS